MKKFISTNIHWILFVLVLINLIVSMTNFTNSTPDIIALSFGIVAFVGVGILVCSIEVERRRKKEKI
ncbi:hypothetical protein ACFQ4N_16410 [Oceanobacillus iheyensis]|uniref:hypothetical protein n=1 Tax=Oceanobacillus iheyensis TaxID=182710 RepID=UPI00362CF906